MSFKNNKYTNFTPSPPPPSAVLNIPTTTARRKIGNFWFWKVDQVQRFWTRPTLWHNEFPVESPASKGTSGSSSSLFQSLWMFGCFLLSYGVCTVKLKVRPWVCVMGINRHSFFRCRWWWRSRRRKIMGQERHSLASITGCGRVSGQATTIIDFYWYRFPLDGSTKVVLGWRILLSWLLPSILPPTAPNVW